MNFPDSWPANCPPADADDAHGDVFRVVKHDPPQAEDTASHMETGKLPKAPACLRCGLSVFREIRDVVHQRQLLPKLGNLIATATLLAEHGKTKLTKGTQPTHTTWWAYEGVNRAALFSVVREEDYTMWSIPGRSVPVARFQPFDPAEVLYEFDGPRIFTLWDSEGELNLAYWSDEDEHLCRYAVVPTTAKILEALRQGEISVFDALNQPRCWLCDVTHLGEIVACQRVEFEAIPRDSLPAVGTMLLPTLEPQLVDLEGRIRELDKDRRSFELREIPGASQAQRFAFDEDLRNDVFEAFREDVRVRVSGRTLPVKNMAHALALSKVGAGS